MLRLQGDLDVRALERSLEQVIERHESLRTHFVEVDGEPQQVIEPAGAFALEVEDLSRLSGESREEQVAGATGAGVGARPFDLARGPVFRRRIC